LVLDDDKERVKCTKRKRKKRRLAGDIQREPDGSRPVKDDATKEPEAPEHTVQQNDTEATWPQEGRSGSKYHGKAKKKKKRRSAKVSVCRCYTICVCVACRCCAGPPGARVGLHNTQKCSYPREPRLSCFPWLFKTDTRLWLNRPRLRGLAMRLMRHRKASCARRV
jgi:hypothetical protein